MSELKVKFLARTAADQDPALWLSLFPGRHPVHKGVRFSFDPNDQSYDWLVVYEDLPYPQGSKKSMRVEPLACARDNTLFITTEPHSIKIYGPQYLSQFGHVLSMQPRHILGHKSQIERTPPLRWYYGRPFEPGMDYTNWDQMMARKPPLKTGQASTVCSSKQMGPVFKQRYAFTQALKDGLGDQLDWFGRGVRPIADKSEAMDSFRYHIAIENHIAPGHWTEKIADCFLAICLPLYAGPPDIGDVFPVESFVPIDVNNQAQTLETIKQLIRDDAYTKRLPAIIEARQRVLNDYNLMFVISDIVLEKHQSLSGAPVQSILGRHRFRKSRPLRAMSDAIHRLKHAPKK